MIPTWHLVLLAALPLVTAGSCLLWGEVKIRWTRVLVAGIAAVIVDFAG